MCAILQCRLGTDCDASDVKQQTASVTWERQSQSVSNKAINEWPKVLLQTCSPFIRPSVSL